MNEFKENYFNMLRDNLIYPLKNSDGMLNLASMQRVFILKDKVILVKGENKISVLTNNEFEYYIFNDENDLFKYITCTFINNKVIISFSLVKKINNELVIFPSGAIMEINDKEPISENEKIIASDLLKTIINIQNTGYANILSITSIDIIKTCAKDLLNDLSIVKNTIINDFDVNFTLKRG